MSLEALYITDSINIHVMFALALYLDIDLGNKLEDGMDYKLYRRRTCLSSKTIYKILVQSRSDINHHSYAHFKLLDHKGEKGSQYKNSMKYSIHIPDSSTLQTTKDR